MDAVPDRVKPATLDRPTRAEAERAVEVLLRWAGDDPNREGLRDTPRRVASAMQELYSGYEADADDILGRRFEEAAGYDDPVLMRNISFYSHCEHHMLPIVGKAHIAYVPNGAVVGLSKLARVVEVYARRLQIQETLTTQIAQTIQDTLQPKGVAVLISAEHTCMAMRGIEKPGTRTTTTSYTGLYADDAAEQAGFLALLGTPE